MSQSYAEVLSRRCPGLDINTQPCVLASHGKDWSRMRPARPSAVVFPRSVGQVKRLVGVAFTHRIPLVPSGGRTGLSGGAIAAAGEVVVSFDRMRGIGKFDAVDRTLTVQPGVVTQAVQTFASEHGLFYPVSFAAEGSSQIGGNIATNAGGVRVLRYGLTRDQVAGLKVVDGRGELIDCSRSLIKNASGYDLRHLFIGSEGTLGLIVEATLRLQAPPPPARVMLLAVADLDALVKVFRFFNDAVSLTAFEFFCSASLAHVRTSHDLPAPLEQESPYCALIEFDCDDEAEAGHGLHCFENCLDRGLVLDGVVNHNVAQASALWRYREGITEAIAEHSPFKHDLSVPVSALPGYLDALERVVNRLYPEFEVLWFGHIGDGNLHMNILKPANMSQQCFEASCARFNPEIYALTTRFNGSISAEHGIGLLKQPYLGYVRSEVEIERMRALKAVFDPVNIMNPGKLLG